MTVTITDFIAAYPEFYDGQDPQPRPSIVNGWIEFAYLMLPAARWGAALDRGVMLYTAHQVAIHMRDAKAGTVGGAAGTASGPVASKTVDKVSVSYDTSSFALTDGGHWNLTSYGVQFLQLARMFGSGGVQL